MVLWHIMLTQCLPFYIINEVGHLTTSVDHLAEFCQNYHLAAICTQLMVKFFLQLRFIQYFDCKCMKIPDFSRIDSHFVASILILGNNGLHQLITTSHLLWVRGNTVTHWGRDKMATNFLTTFLNAFFLMKKYQFWLQFHWLLFLKLRVQLTLCQH